MVSFVLFVILHSCFFRYTIHFHLGVFLNNQIKSMLISNKIIIWSSPIAHAHILSTTSPLDWVTGGHGSYICLEDDDVSTVSSSAKLKRLNTLQHYRLPSNAKITLIEHPHSTDDVHKINGWFM